VFSAEVLDCEMQQLAASRRKPERGEDGERNQDPPISEDPAQKRALICEQLSAKFDLSGEYRIIRITKYLSEPPEYAIETANGNCIRLGGVINLIDPRALKAKLADLAKRAIPNFKNDAQWQRTQQLLLDACVDVPVGEEGTDVGLMNSRLSAYIRVRPVLDSYDESDDTQSPFLRKGHIHIYLSDLLRWIHINHNERISSREMGVRMRRVGAEPENVPYGKSSHHVWMLPKSFVPPGRTEVPKWVAEEQPDEERVN
jgi:hypothetical protein